MFTRLPTDRIGLVEAARGARRLDLAITNVQLVNVLSCEIYPADIGIYGGRVAVVGPAGSYPLDATATIDGTGKWACPGLFDTHLHIESTMVTPAGYARGVLPHGTTSVVVDPHEIGNVMGKDGIRLMIDGSRDLPLRVYFAISSCVPSVMGHESSGATFLAEDIAEMMSWERVVSLAEVMDFVGLINNDPRMRGVVDAALSKGTVVQGHAPMVHGRELNAYIAAGADNDHESVSADEALEKLRLGLLPLIARGSMTNRLPDVVAGLLKAPHFDVAMCTDDVEPSDLLHKGHMDRVVRDVIGCGVPPARALRWACYVGPQHYGMRDFGAIAPGFVADILLLDSLNDVRVSDVFVEGKQVVDGGKILHRIVDPLIEIQVPQTVVIKQQFDHDFHIEVPNDETGVTLNGMDLLPSGMTSVVKLSLPTVSGGVRPQDLDTGLCMTTVVPRHGQNTPNVSVLLRGYGLQRGALAHSVSHDSHNILVTGRSDADMRLAVETLEKIGGGFALVDSGKVVATVPLPFAGLMSFEDVPELTTEVEAFNVELTARGVSHASSRPMMILVGLSLAVIPTVRVTDMHPLFDVTKQESIPMFA